MTSTPADPGAIDLDNLYEKAGWLNPVERALVAAVETLREREAAYDTIFDLQRKRERPWIEAWQKASGKPNTLPDYGEMLNWLCGQIEAVEAREAVLAGALDDYLITSPPITGSERAVAVRVRAALATIPAQALERARAVEAVVKAARFFMEDGIAEDSQYLNQVAWSALDGAMTKLDTLNKEQP